MRLQWWAAPLAALLILAGMAAGLYLGRPAHRQPDRFVKVPTLGDRSPATPSPGPAPAKPLPKPAVPDQPAATKPAEPKRPSDEEALRFIDRFMQARMAGKAADVAAMVAPGMTANDAIRLSGPGARITGYRAELLGSGDPDSFAFRLYVAVVTGQPHGEVNVEAVHLAWRNGLRISAYGEVAKESLALGPGADGKLHFNRGPHTLAAADLTALPDKFRPYGAAPDVEFGVGKDGWSVAATALDGSRVLWVTKGLHPLLGVSEPAAGKVTPLDLLFEARGVDAAFAPDGSRFVAVTVAQPSGATDLFVWDLTKPVRFGPDLSARLGGPDYAVENVRWRPDGMTVLFDLKRHGTVTGPWAYHVGTKELTAP